MTTRALTAPTPVISSSLSARPSGVVPSSAQPGACPPPASPQAVRAGAVPGMAASCCPIASSSRVISSLIVSISRRCVLTSNAWMSRNRPVSAASSSLRVAFSRGSPSAASAAGLRSPATRASRNRRPLAPNRSETLYRGLADNSVGRVIDALLRNDLILIDEVGFAPLDDTGAQLLFRVVAAACERRALGIASHWPFESWGRFLPEHTTAVSLLDNRLLHHANVVVTAGDSYRMREARAKGGTTLNKT